MNKTNKEFRQMALAKLKGNWTDPVIAALVYYLLLGLMQCLGFIPFAGILLYILIAVPFTYGAFYVFYLNFYRGEKVEIETLFAGYKDFGRVFTTMLLMYLYIGLWMLLLIIPGYIKMYSYALTPFILADNPELRNNEAIELSMKMMDGYKMKLFLLHLSFIGWAILCIFTLGIGYLWLMPYVCTAQTAFYEELKNKYAAEDYQ